MSDVRFDRMALLCLAILLAFSFPASAQSDYGSIGGFVKDPSGAVVPKAKGLVKNEATGQTVNATTNDAGYYVATNLQPGYYTVDAEAAGFKKYESTHNKLDANSALSLDAALTVGSSTETVEVSATAAALQTESGPCKMKWRPPGAGSGAEQPQSRLHGVFFRFAAGDLGFQLRLPAASWQINGARTWDTVVTFDGAPAVRTRANGAVIGVADVDTTQEIQVMTADYAAEYGRAAGGQIRIVTKSGTRDFHGTLYEYFRNSDMNANTWSRKLSTQTNSATPLRYTNFDDTPAEPLNTPAPAPQSRAVLLLRR
jgi:hypothetical protein